MQRLLWVGHPYFAGSLEACGWETVVIHKLAQHRVFTWPDLVGLAGFEPDVLVVADHSVPPFVVGMENFPCITVFYSIDSHIHSWHPFYAQGFDACLVSLADHMPRFVGPGLARERIWNSPPFAKDQDRPDYSVKKEWDCLFVGNMDPELKPGRVKFMTELQKLVPGLKICKGSYRELFPRAKTLINYADAGDLNFRVFEALGCGGCLVTPRIGHGMEKLFIDGEHLVGYAQNDPGDAAYRIKFLLEHPEVAEHIGKTGLAEIDAKHRPIHRAQAFTDNLCDLAINGAENIIAARMAKAEAIRKSSLEMLYLHWAENFEDAEKKRLFLAAARGKLPRIN